MPGATVAVGSVAFVGPAHVDALTEFRYVRVTSLDGEQAKVVLIDPDSDDEDLGEEIDVAVLKRRLVSEEERALLPGTYVGHPIAFIQPDGPTMDQWDFGIVTGYRMIDAEGRLHVRHATGTCKVVLQLESNVIKVDGINYALQPSAGANAAVVNADELVEIMNGILESCNKNRGVPAKVKNSLSTPYDPTGRVTVIRPDTLELVSVPREHVIDGALRKKAKKGMSMFVPPPSQDGGQAQDQRNKRRATSPPATRQATRQKTVQENHELLSGESDTEESPLPTATNDDDLQAVLFQNRPQLSTRPTAGRDEPPTTKLDAAEDARRPPTTTFRPTTYATRSSIRTIKARDGDFRRTPPVLRGAYDFGFHVRGLSVTHFAQYTASMMLDDSTTTVNMSDFSRKNSLQAAASSPSYSELVESLRNLRQFSRTFYNATTVDVIDTAAAFIDAFGDGGAPDSDTTRRLLLWLNMKLGKLRGLVLSGGGGGGGGLGAAVRVKTEFSLQDPLLAKLLYDQQQAKIAELLAQLDARPVAAPPARGPSREPRPEKQNGVPKAVLRNLPKQGSLQLCMKHLSRAGCSGNGVPGKCFSTKRAHFRPKTLPANVKEYIEQRFGGLAPDVADP